MLNESWTVTTAGTPAELGAKPEPDCFLSQHPIPKLACSETPQHRGVLTATDGNTLSPRVINMQGFGEKKSSPNGQITLNIILILKHTGLLQKRVRNLNYFTVKHEAPSPRPLSTRSAPGQVLASTGSGGGAPDAVPRHRLLLFPHEGHTVGAPAVSRHLQPTP